MKAKTQTDKTRLVQIARELGNIKVVYDVGALHALDGIELAQELEANELHVFECNPPSADNCERNLQTYLRGASIAYSLCRCAIADSERELVFHPIDTEKTITSHADGNPGASSIFLANGKYSKEQYVQRTIKVKATALDNYCDRHAAPDLLWLDLQGAEVMALKGARRALSKTRIVHTEVSFRPMYSGQSLFWDIDHELRFQGFKLAYLEVGRWPVLPRLYSLLRWGPWLGNAIYNRIAT